MKDEKPWSNQVELSLDNRQIFLLFFASAVLLSLVFALGVVVGKRMDSRARSRVTDPLALLDQMGGDDSDDNLSYQQALSPSASVTAAKSPTAEPAIVSKPAPAPEHAEVKKTAHPALKSVHTVKSIAAAADEDEGAAWIKDKHKSKDVERDNVKVKVKPKEKDKPSRPTKVGSGQEAGETYTLQLSSFQEKREAEALIEKLQQAGLKPYMTPTNIPGRGVWYRVRLGRFKSWDEALTAKQNFEKQQKIIAYVSKS